MAKETRWLLESSIDTKRSFDDSGESKHCIKVITELRKENWHSGGYR